MTSINATAATAAQAQEAPKETVTDAAQAEAMDAINASTAAAKEAGRQAKNLMKGARRTTAAVIWSVAAVPAVVAGTFLLGVQALTGDPTKTQNKDS